MWSNLVNAIKVEYNSIRILPQAEEMGPEPIPPSNSVYDPRGSGRSYSRLSCIGQYRTHNLRISRRTCVNASTVTLQGWPSRGGIIVLENTTPPDFDFLHIDPLDPPLRRSADQDTEDVFCQALLRLGATWWDSETRQKFVRGLEYGCEEDHEALEADESLRPTRLECGWVRVAWPSHAPGTLCVLACDKSAGRRGLLVGEKERPNGYGIVALARTMDERCTVLQRLGGTMYPSIDHVQEPTYLRAWEENFQGEKGRLAQYAFIDPKVYGGHHDDALGRFYRSEMGTENV